MMRGRLQACLPAVAFAALAAVMTAAGGVPSVESALAALSVGLGIIAWAILALARSFSGSSVAAAG